jgi:hypothetical protein
MCDNLGQNRVLGNKKSQPAVSVQECKVRKRRITWCLSKIIINKYLLEHLHIVHHFQLLENMHEASTDLVVLLV